MTVAIVVYKGLIPVVDRILTKDKQEGASRVFIAIDEKLYAFYNIRLGNKLVKQLFPNKIFLNKDDYHDPLKNIEELLFSL